MSPSSLRTLLDFFPAGATEAERHILPRAFVHWDAYQDLITPPPTSPRILVGRKGTGKTAVLDFYAMLLRESGVPVLQLRPMDLDTLAFPEAASLGEATRVALRTLSEAVARKLGSELGMFVKEGDKPLRDAVLEAGDRSPDVVEKLSRLLPRLAAGFAGIDGAALDGKHTTASLSRLNEAIAANVSKSGKTFHLYLDDTDQVAAPDEPRHLQRIWAFLLATRELSQKVPQLRCVVTLREEVWRRLLRDKAGQRDQADHFLPLVRVLFPTRFHIADVVRRRLLLASEALELDPKNPYTPFFEGTGARMPGSREFSNWEDLVVIRSRERPRDAIQLINILATAADGRGADRIGEGDFDKQIAVFSRQRVELLAQELDQECPQIVEVVGALGSVDFDHGSFKSTTEAFRKTLRRIPSEFGVILRGRKLRPTDDEDVLQLWSFLYELGVVNARISDKREKDGFRHVLPSQEPRLVSKARWNEMQAVVWEINPAYRDFLIGKQQEVNARVGLPPGRRKGRRPR